MPIRWVVIRLVVVAVVMLATEPLHSQNRSQLSRALLDSSPAQIMAHGRGGVLYEPVVDVLRQQSRPQSVGKRAELADSVVALAIRTAGANMAVTVLGAAGHPSHAREPGTPEPRALDWLIRVHRESQHNPTRRAAIHSMMDQVDPARAIPYLRQVATTSDDETAWVALAKLIAFGVDERLGSPGERQQRLADLRAMWDQRLVRNSMAMSDFRFVAATRGWPVPPQLQEPDLGGW